MSRALRVVLCLVSVLLAAGCATTQVYEAGRVGDAAVTEEGGAPPADAVTASGELARLSEEFDDSAAGDVRRLIEAGADVDVLNRYGATPLMMASVWNLPSVVRILIDAGADLNVADENGGFTAISAAVQRGNIAVVSLLISAGADLDLGDAEGCTPLWWAASDGREEIVRMLLDAGADPNASRRDGMTAGKIAAVNGFPEIGRILLDAGSPLQSGGEFALIQATRDGDLAAVRALLSSGESVHTKDGSGLTALHWAVTVDVPEIVSRLLDAGASPNEAGPGGATPLCGAASYASGAVVRMLLEAGADVNIAREDGTTSLMLAVFAANAAAVELLIEANADLDARNADGWTALTCAAWSGDVDSARLLLNAGADPMIPKNDGWIPVDVAERRGSYAVADALMAAMPGDPGYSGGRGLALERAVVIEGTEDCNSFYAVGAESRWVGRHHPRWVKGMQQLVEAGDRVYDVIDYSIPDGSSVRIFYDITDCFGF